MVYLFVKKVNFYIFEVFASKSQNSISVVRELHHYCTTSLTGKHMSVKTNWDKQRSTNFFIIKIKVFFSSQLFGETSLVSVRLWNFKENQHAQMNFFRQSCDKLWFIKKCQNRTFKVNFLCQKFNLRISIWETIFCKKKKKNWLQFLNHFIF